MSKSNNNNNNMNHLHLAYLQQVSQLISDKHKPLAAYYGFIAKKIELKHLVHIKGWDPPKIKRCKACQAPINCDSIHCKSKKLVVECSLCGFTRRFSNSRHESAAKSCRKKKTKKQKKKPDGECDKND